MRHSIKIPDFLLRKLRNSIYNSLIEDFLWNYEDWIKRNETIFFREYTDHGIEHLEGVMETSVSLMTKSSSLRFNDSDACLLIVSIILHDVALHLQEDQFVKLVDGETYCNLIKGLDSDTWKSLWLKYAAEASRFSQSQLQLYFGVTSPIPIPNLNDTSTWTPHQYQLIGEFLRRHHPRLAHDFAVYGFPIVDDQQPVALKTPNGQFTKMTNLAGLIARSHGTSLRDLFAYLEDNFGHLRTPEGSHAIYLMVLLRIADYLQLQSSRAPKGQMTVKNLKSPLSRKEWSIHSAIQNIIYNRHEDPESVEVIIDSSKINIEIYLRIENLLYSIQKELDHSWAVLGEVFGRFPEKSLGLTIRRVRSNIDDKLKFSRQAGFVTERATFTAADSELLKLFIKPLYGDKPEIAVRELVQNSLDAVRERLIFEANSGDLENSVAVTVSIHKDETGKWLLRVEDKGIGMNLRTLTGYFLNAGASYRLSTVWKQKFLDEKGKSKILRSGRFGVGALAAFMLAEDPTSVEMKVITRHITSDKDGALEFTTTLSDTPIQIKYVEKDEPGTIIEITTRNPPAFMQESTKDNLGSNWDWFCLDKPIVERISLNGKRLQQSVLLPSSVSTSKYDYHWIHPKDYDAIGWSYSQYPAVVCNGIIVVNNDSNNRYSLEEGKFLNKDIKIIIPPISIFDKDGKLPITLDRLRVEYDQLQFLGDIREDITKNLIAFLLISAPINGVGADGSYNEPLLRTHPAIKASLNRIPWLLTETGSVLYCPELMGVINERYIIEIEDSAMIPLVLTAIESESCKIAFAIDIYSTWDELRNNAKLLSGTRVKIERQRLEQRKLYKILDLLDGSMSPKVRGLVSGKSIDKFFLSRFGQDSGVSLDHLVDILRDEVYQLGGSGQFNSSDVYGEIMEMLSRGELGAEQLTQIIYKIGTTAGRFSIDDLMLFVNGLKQSSYPDESKVQELIYLIDREIENLLELHLGVDGEEFYRFREEVQVKLRNADRRPHRVDYRNLEQVLDEIRRLNFTPLISEIESFGNGDTILDWEKIKGFIFNRQSSQFPVGEMVFDDGFEYNSSNNFLSKIWLEFIGKYEIPFDIEERTSFVENIENKFGLKRHIDHWRSVFDNENLKKKIK